MAEEPVKVLVVDDKTDIRLLLCEFLHIEKYQTIQAAHADEAVQLAAAEKPALIFMDVMMPGRDGLSAIEEIRRKDPVVGIIVMTAYSTEQRAVRSLQVGADDYMHKPFEPSELRLKANSVLSRYKLRQENQRLQQRLTDILGRYMPAPVAQRLINAPEMPRLGGERQTITILFADLRGFTAFASVTPPEKVVQYLNKYLSAAAGPILNHNGTLDKFLGDGMTLVST
jgi:DNA-binding response OmpR family regulator